MEDKIENIAAILAYWKESADQDFTTMEHLLETKDYSWSLFMGHLVLEKLLKAVYVKRNQKHALFTHDLLRLSDRLALDLTEEQIDWLDEISTYNLNARYDNYKQDFRNICTKEFTAERIDRIKTLREWLIQKL